MNFDKIPTPEEEKKIPKITTEELLKHSGGSKDDDKEFKAWLEARGIEFDDNGIAEVELDGEVVKTKEDDFGTIIQEPDAIIEKSKA